MKKIKDVFSKVQFTQTNIFLSIIVFLLLICLLILANIVGDQSGVTKSTRKSESLIDSIQQFQAELVTYAKNTNGILKSISTNVVDNQNELSKVVDAFKQDQEKVAELIKTSQSRAEKFNTTVQNTLKTQSKALSTVINTLKSSADEVTTTISLYAEITNGKKYETAKDYTIYAVENYGVVLQDRQGNFILAQINKPLDIGTINAITDDFVLAGSYRIIKQNDFQVQPNTQYDNDYYN